MKQGRCQCCGKIVGKVPDDAEDITCFECDQKWIKASDEVKALDKRFGVGK